MLGMGHSLATVGNVVTKPASCCGKDGHVAGVLRSTKLDDSTHYAAKLRDIRVFIRCVTL